MRGKGKKQISMLCVVSPDQRVPKNHPIRKIKALSDEALKNLSPVFDDLYCGNKGRESIPPERLLKSTILMALYSIPSERRFCQDLDFNLLYRWFLDMDLSEESFDHSSFTTNRARLLEHEVAQKFFQEIVVIARKSHLFSEEHFSVDGTLIEAWASMKSFRPKDEPPSGDGPNPSNGFKNPDVDFHGEERKNDTHESRTDPEAKLLRKGKGKEAKLCYTGHALMENRNGLLRDFWVTPSVGITESEAASAMLMGAGLQGTEEKTVTVAGDKGYDNAEFIAECRDRKIAPHVARNTGRNGGSALDEATALTVEYTISQRIRKRIEEIFGWIKTVGGFRKTRYIGLEKTQWAAYLVGSAYNLLRIVKLLGAAV